MQFNQEKIQKLKKTYTPGIRIRLLEMNDPYHPVEPGTLGKVESVDDAGNIHMLWDNGRTLALVAEADRFEIVEEG